LVELEMGRDVTYPKESVEKPVSQRLIENVQMQGFRNPEE
jgi:hypothetical protein